jgi:hypothetical protein
MNRFGMSVSALVFFAAVSLPCVAQDNPWNGSWKLDTSSVKYTGPTFSIITDADGYTLKMGSEAGTKTVCDGKPQSGPNGTMVTCTRTGSSFEVDTTRNGSPTRNMAMSVSVDGKSLTRTAKIFPPDDSPYTMTMTSTRVSGGPGVAGAWKQVDVSESQDAGLLTFAVSGDSIDFKETDRSKPTTCKLDGTELKTSDTTSMAIKLVDPNTLKVTYTGDGKVRRENTFVLSSDGKTVTETDITPDPAPSTTSMLFHKA